MSDSLWPNGLQHARLPCPLPTPGAYWNSCPLNQWCHPIIILCDPLVLLPSIFPSIRVLPNESVLCIRWPKHWSFSLSISPSTGLSLQETMANHFRILALRTPWTVWRTAWEGIAIEWFHVAVRILNRVLSNRIQLHV